MIEEQPSIESSHLVDLVRAVCVQMSLTFSENDVNQALADVHSRDDGSYPFHEALLAIGQRIGVRFREVESHFSDLRLAAIETNPIIVSRSTSSQAAKKFVILRQKSRSKFVIWIDGGERVVSTRWLRTNIASVDRNVFRWFIAQPILAADSASAYNYQTGTLEKPLSPLRRLFSLWQPEAADIRSVIVFAVFVGILSLTTPLAVEALVNTVAFGRYLQPLIVLSLIVFVFLAFRAGILVLMTIVVEIIQRRLFVRVVDDLSLRLTRVPLAFLKRHHGTELVNRFFDIVSVQKITSKLLLESLLLVLQTVIGLTVLAFYHPFLLGYDLGLIVLMTVVLYAIGKGAIRTAKAESADKYETAAWLQEIVRHPTTFKFNGGLGFAINRADELTAHYLQSRKAHFRILIRQVTFSMLMQAVAATVLLGLGGWLVIEGQMTLGQLVAAELIVTVILSSFAKVGKDLESFYDLVASVDKLGKIFDLPGEPADKLRLAGQAGPAAIELVNLKFLATQKQTNAVIEPGTATAVVGPSGSGKTKVVETIGGLHEPLDGYVLINQFRVDLLGSVSLQSQLSFINDIEIFAGTVDENLRLGRSHITSHWLSEIVERLGLHETISSLEQGFKTELSISGFPLSTGQAIRLVLARALIAKPSALLIDHLLDRLADDDLVDVLQRLEWFKSHTTIVIATGRKQIAKWSDQTVELSA